MAVMHTVTPPWRSNISMRRETGACSCRCRVPVVVVMPNRSARLSANGSNATRPKNKTGAAHALHAIAGGCARAVPNRPYALHDTSNVERNEYAIGPTA